MDEDYRDLEATRDVSRLLEIMHRLRDPETGCEWDIKQTFASIAPYTIEEAYEVKDAIQRQDMNDLCDELGDLLLQVVYHAQIASEMGAFDFGDVVQAINKKMLRRHPHVFGTLEQKKNGMQPGTWERIKSQERAEKDAKTPDKANRTDGLLDTVPAALPALSQALKLQKRASTVGFDWHSLDLVFEKLKEELAELDDEVTNGNEDRIRAEMGDIFFVIVNVARHLGIDPEQALDQTNQKFRDRFRFIEESLKDEKRSLDQATLDEMEALWQAAKVALKA